MPGRSLVAIVDDDESVRETTKDLLALKAGVCAYLAKPFTDDALLGCISSAVRRRNI